MRRFAVLFIIIFAVHSSATESEKSTAPGEATAPSAVSGSDKIWSAVILATKPPVPKADPPELSEFVPRLKRVFGYTQYEVIGATTEKIGDKSESWLVPSRNFWLEVKARRVASKEARGGYLLNLHFFQDKRPILETEAKLAPGSPLFIRGPQHGSGQVIIVLQVLR